MTAAAVTGAGNATDSPAQPATPGQAAAPAPAVPQQQAAQPAATKQPAQDASPKADTAAKTEPPRSVIADALSKLESEAAGGASQPASPYEIKAPQGIHADSEVLAQFGKAAQEMAIAPEQAQRIVDTMLPAIQARQTAQIQQVSAQWREKAMQDPEIGGKNWDATMRFTALGARELGFTPELMDILDRSGLANHPDLIRSVRNAGQRLAQSGRLVIGKANPAPQPKSLGDLLFADVKPH
jgi:hypothetical protein